MISQESARYIGNCLIVYRVRPRDPNDDARSDEDFSDEEFCLIEADLEKAMKTMVGGLITNKRNEKVKSDTSKATHEDNSRSGMDLASHILFVGDDTGAVEHVMPATNQNDIDASMVAARASQRTDKAGTLSTQQRMEKEKSL